MATERSTSVWLVPAEPHRAELRHQIDELALKYGTPAFEPHITLAAVDVAQDVIVAGIERIAAGSPPLKVIAGPTAHSPERFKAVLIEFLDDHLDDLAGAVSGALGIPFERDRFQPHLSLLYAADLPRPLREDIANERNFVGRTFAFDTLVVSIPANDIDDVAAWQSPVVRRLTGPPSQPPLLMVERTDQARRCTNVSTANHPAETVSPRSLTG